MAPNAHRVLLRILFAAASVVCGTAPARAAEEGAPKPPELQVLERLVGEWNSESVSRVAEWTPVEARTTGVLTREWMLNGFFVQERAMQSDTDALVIFTYDSSKRSYRYWQFNGKGHAFETSGQWDEASKTLNCTADLDNGLTNTSSIQFIDNDTHTWKAIVRDRQGKVYFDGEGTCRRRK